MTALGHRRGPPSRAEYIVLGLLGAIGSIACGVAGVALLVYDQTRLHEGVVWTVILWLISAGFALVTWASPYGATLEYEPDAGKVVFGFIVILLALACVAVATVAIVDPGGVWKKALGDILSDPAKVVGIAALYAGSWLAAILDQIGRNRRAADRQD